jgi:hypothetical protein
MGKSVRKASLSSTGREGIDHDAEQQRPNYVQKQANSGRASLDTNTQMGPSSLTMKPIGIESNMPPTSFGELREHVAKTIRSHSNLSFEQFAELLKQRMR